MQASLKEKKAPSHSAYVNQRWDLFELAYGLQLLKSELSSLFSEALVAIFKIAEMG